MAKLLFICSLLMPGWAMAAIDVYEFDSSEQELLFHQLTKELRCPKCQNQNISDSNAPLAKDLRQKTYELVKQGNDRDQVVDYMAARFGNFVRYDPPMTPATVFLWLGPVCFIAIGLFFVFRHASRPKAKMQVSELATQEQEKLNRILNKDNTE
ncbi:cytochrome c-type biogenesis protein [Motilimonas pumila]|uniref:Cytochrome c-type biogenesis protein n=1 Tax=Motilimonas pumila TaxID=2303987 RepID=A0A418YGX0_9GAMM|nr:cytochrome c-type biogenesis protein [Motilimonas pumila]RJG49054.1 cytochrome c-type biogenesis protein CcmH [Motilimonas pumila]